jgi:hypothetical protein
VLDLLDELSLLWVLLEDTWLHLVNAGLDAWLLHLVLDARLLHLVLDTLLHAKLLIVGYTGRLLVDKHALMAWDLLVDVGLYVGAIQDFTEGIRPCNEAEEEPCPAKGGHSSLSRCLTEVIHFIVTQQPNELKSNK